MCKSPHKPTSPGRHVENPNDCDRGHEHPVRVSYWDKLDKWECYPGKKVEDLC
jgi:hypothetical protein